MDVDHGLGFVAWVRPARPRPDNPVTNRAAPALQCHHRVPCAHAGIRRRLRFRAGRSVVPAHSAPCVPGIPEIRAGASALWPARHAPVRLRRQPHLVLVAICALFLWQAVRRSDGGADDSDESGSGGGGWGRGGPTPTVPSAGRRPRVVAGVRDRVRRIRQRPSRPGGITPAVRERDAPGAQTSSQIRLGSCPGTGRAAPRPNRLNPRRGSSAYHPRPAGGTRQDRRKSAVVIDDNL